MARAQTALGDYDSAVKSAQQATKIWPSDIESYLELARAFGQGKLSRNRDIDRALLMQPWLTLLLPQLPKVLIKNESEYALTLRFIPDQGQPYPQVQVRPKSSRIAALFPGRFKVLIESSVGKLENQHSFEAGEDYQLIYSAKSFPTATFIVTNSGNYMLQIQMSGPTKTSVALRPQETKSITVSPGTYSVTARIPGASKSDQFELSAGQEETIKYEYRIGKIPVFDPSQLTIKNDGNAALTATLSGPRRYTLNVPPGGKTFTLPAGTYAIRVSCGGHVSDAGEHELKPNYETTIDEYSCNIRYVIR